MHGIVAYRSTFPGPNVCEEEIRQFPSSAKKDAQKRKSVPVFLRHSVELVAPSVGRRPPID